MSEALPLNRKPHNNLPAAPWKIAAARLIVEDALGLLH